MTRMPDAVEIEVPSAGPGLEGAAESRPEAATPSQTALPARAPDLWSDAGDGPAAGACLGHSRIGCAFVKAVDACKKPGEVLVDPVAVARGCTRRS